MRVMQFGFGRGGEYHLPHRYPRSAVAYTGTHDNQTAVGWFKSLAHDSDRRRRALEYLGAMPATIHLDMIRALMTSVANTVIFPVQDLLGLGAQSRMNTPGVAEGNWNWRLRGGELTAAVAHHLRQLTEYTNRV
jgi:4-alpha-glucanotransferase